MTNILVLYLVTNYKIKIYKNEKSIYPYVGISSRSNSQCTD